MLQKLILIGSLLAFVVLSSCQKELEEPSTPTGTVDTTRPFIDTTIVKTTSDSYLPLTKNTFWKYRDSVSGSFKTITVFGNQIRINSRSYNVMTGSFWATPIYYAVIGNDYYIQQELEGVPVEILFLNDVASVGDSWTVDMGIINGDATTGLGSIIKKGMTLKVEGKTYQNVIHSRFSVYYKIANVTHTSGGYDYYTAKGVGIVRLEGNFGIDGVQILYSETKTLVDFSIK